MKKIGDTTNTSKITNKRKKNMKKVAIAYGIGIIALIYFVYCIIQLIKQPTDIIAIEQGNLSEEENAVRLCYT